MVEDRIYEISKVEDRKDSTVVILMVRTVPVDGDSLKTHHGAIPRLFYRLDSMRFEHMRGHLGRSSKNRSGPGFVLLSSALSLVGNTSNPICC